MMLERLPDAPPIGRPRKPHGKRPLATVLRENGAFSTPHAVDLALDVCDALSTAHANGIVHGQLGLRCVRLTYTFAAGPRDVEIFTLAADGDSGVALEMSPFLAPEQRELDRPIDARADIWALGAIFYTVLVGQPLPAGPVQIPEGSMPSSLEALVGACLAADPESRPQTVDEIAEKIASFATWPPDRFASLAERRDRRVAAENARLSLERRGLGNVPSVLDKLDEAALTRAQRTNETAEISSLLHGKTTEAALERLMTVVHQGTDAARVELASALPALIDFDDEDDDVVPTIAIASEEPSSPMLTESPLTIPPVALLGLVPIEPAPAAPSALAPLELSPAPSPPASPTRRRGAVIAIAIATTTFAAFAIGLAIASAMSNAPAAAPHPSTATATPTATPTAASADPEPAPIPVFAPSSLPEAPAITPQSLPEAKP